MSESEPISIFDSSAVDKLRAELRFDPQLLRRVRTRFFKKSAASLDSLEALPASVRTAFADRVRFSELELERRLDSSIDGASRLIFKTRSGFAIESVVLRAGTGRVALCVSSQVGCAAACDFCATGRMGIARDLSAGEILDQVVQANRLLRSEGRRVRNIVFMGMGEPFHNESHVHAALDSLISDRQFHHPPSRILLSTVGIPAALVRCAERFPRVNYALSLHAANQAVRERLIPLARRHTIDDLRRAVAEVNRIQTERQAVMLEYLLLDSVNDGAGQVDALIDWTRGLRVHVNLIPFNAIDDAPHLTASPRDTIEAVGRKIRGAGIPTTIRYSMGSDISAACGQLVQSQNRSIARAALSQ